MPVTSALARGSHTHSVGNETLERDRGITLTAANVVLEREDVHEALNVERVASQQAVDELDEQARVRWSTNENPGILGNVALGTWLLGVTSGRRHADNGVLQRVLDIDDVELVVDSYR